MPPRDSSRKSRRLNSEDMELWSRVTKTAIPLSAQKPLMTENTGKAPQKAPAPHPIKAFDITPSPAAPLVRYDLAPDISEQVSSSPVAMDKKAFTRLKRGKLSPEARLDLHGLTLAQAHPRLIGFIKHSYARGNRLVLVITGKGKQKDSAGPIPVRTGILRHEVPLWLKQPSLQGMVLQIVQANPKHGGTGAYYVYLKRQR